MNSSTTTVAMPDQIDRISQCRRPETACIGYHCWTDLLFVHWRVPAEQLAPLVPSGLTIDTFDGDAWVGLVPFHMSGVRPKWFPALPGVSNFHETNVRTYVHREGRDPGVWFFSLEASRSLPVLVARSRWRLNYHRAAMQLERTGSRIRYASSRLWPGRRGAGMDAEIELQDVDQAYGSGQVAVPGTLEHFLIERYILYTQARSGRLLRGQVHHSRYRLRPVEVIRLQETLLDAAGIHVNGPPCHAIYNPGVQVEIFPLTAV